MNKPNPIWMRLKSGMILNLIDPSPHCWTNEDLGVRLARTYRWSSDTVSVVWRPPTDRVPAMGDCRCWSEN